MNLALRTRTSGRFAILSRRLNSLSFISHIVLLVFVFGLLWAGSSLAQQKTDSETQVRGMFLDSRPNNTTGKMVKPSRKPGRLALGYTLFLEQSGVARRASPDHVFHSGDRVRLLVESNRDAYLYVFHQEASGPADLLFPDARLHGGENIIGAHQPSFIPYEGWFVFDNRPGDERLTLVVSPKPLVDVPRLAELSTTETFHLRPHVLARLLANSRPVQKDARADDGNPMSPSEGQRGLTLSINDPPPSRVVMNKTAQGGWITAQLVLAHR